MTALPLLAKTPSLNAKQVHLFKGAGSNFSKPHPLFKTHTSTDMSENPMAAKPKVENDSQTGSVSDCDSCLVLELINTFKIPQCGQKK